MPAPQRQSLQDAGDAQRPEPGRAAPTVGDEHRTEPNTKPKVSGRRRRWAPKTKSGCITCRQRRVKCDETKPACERCVAAGKKCAGYNYAVKSPGTDLEIVFHEYLQGKLLWSEADYHCRGRALRRDVLPPDWDFIEGFRYFTEIIVAAHIEAKLADSDYDAQKAATAKCTARDSFLMTVSAHRISAVTRAQGKLPLPNESASILHIWAKFYHYMSLAIQDINRHISGGSPPKAALYRIVDMLEVELRVMSPMWRTHIEGFAALVRKYGGVDKVLQPGSASSPVLALQVILIYTAMGNATSPASDQILACSDWSADDVFNVYSSNLYSDMPCPTDLFIDIIRITRLRSLLAAGASVERVVLPVARQIFRSIRAFSAEDWNEPYPLPKSTKHVLIGRVFKLAVVLYCLLSIPTTATVFWSEADESASRSEWDPKVLCRKELMKQIKMAVEELPVKTPLSWPVTVLGVAYADGTETEQGKIEGFFQEVIKTCYIYSGPAHALAKLHNIWKSGKTGWEDCFDVPCTVLA